jgi:hypothetical protein
LEKRREYNTDISIPEDQKGVKELLSRPLFDIPLRGAGGRFIPLADPMDYGRIP